MKSEPLYSIRIRGARQHNLKDVDVDIPRSTLVVVTGVSGSGKSSLVSDVIVAESHRQYLDSLRVDSRIVLPQLPSVEVDSVEGLSPCIVVHQRPLGRNPRSTVGTVTETYTFLRLLFSRLGGTNLDAGSFSFNSPEGACERCHGIGTELCADLDRILDWNLSLSEGAIRHRTWKVGSRYHNIILATEFFDPNKRLKDFSKEELDRLLHAEPTRQVNAAPGYIQSFAYEGVVSRLKHRLADSRGLQARAYDLSFFKESPCIECRGSRLNSRVRSVCVHGVALGDVVRMDIAKLGRFIGMISEPEAAEAIQFLRRIIDDLRALKLGHLSLSRSISSLSGGESQRLRLARHLGSSLIELLYVFDEPTAGLHASDVGELMMRLRRLVERSNTVLVIEHSTQMIREADHVIELGPLGGSRGGRIIAQGPPEKIAQMLTPTGRALASRQCLADLCEHRKTTDWFTVRDASTNNLKNLCVRIPKRVLVCITGVSGSGKSSLVSEFLRQYPDSALLDQSAAGSNSRSNSLTYIGVFDAVRRLYAKAGGASPALFSFNGKGACRACRGLGVTYTDMHFLGTFERMCDVCKGSRYRPEVLEVRFRGLNIAELLERTVSEGLSILEDTAAESGLAMLERVGLGYLQLGQPLDKLSGGEAQRLRIASRLNRSRACYVLDEPTRGLHPQDVRFLRNVMDDLVKAANSVVVVEHDLDFIASADWVIDLGPGSGQEGGIVVAEGTPEEIAACDASCTGAALKDYLHDSRCR